MVCDERVVIGQCGGCVIALCGVHVLGHVVYLCGCVIVVEVCLISHFCMYQELYFVGYIYSCMLS